jgi:hypothetical protein
VAGQPAAATSVELSVPVVIDWIPAHASSPLSCAFLIIVVVHFRSAQTHWHAGTDQVSGVRGGFLGSMMPDFAGNT